MINCDLLRFLFFLLFCKSLYNYYSPGKWNNLPLIPLADEMMGTPLESDAHLSEVKVNQPYNTSEQYMDTYFRLLRTECFSGMQTGIKDLLSGTLGGPYLCIAHVRLGLGKPS